ncbi:hypothetical protein Tco_1020550 [Tanacetum coccineum]
MRFFKECFDFIICVMVIFSNGGSSASDSDSEFSSAVIAMNSSNSKKISSLRRVHSMEWRILLPSSRRASKSSSKISSITSILKQLGILAKTSTRGVEDTGSLVYMVWVTVFL